jgi:hypothetical protein
MKYRSLLLLAAMPTWAATISPVGANGYYATNFSSTYSTIVGSGGALLPGTSVDDAVVSLTLPFAITLYGTTFGAGATISASTNGNLQFVAVAGASDDFINFPLSSTSTSTIPALTAAGVFPYWDDLILSTSGGGVYWQTVGPPGSQQLIVEWVGRRIGDGATSTNLRFQAVFSEGSPDFVFHYGTTGVGGNANGASATVGVRRDDSNYTEWSLNSPVITPGMSILFSLTDPSAVPEPSTFAMLLVTAACCGVRWYRR